MSGGASIVQVVRSNAYSQPLNYSYSNSFIIPGTFSLACSPVMNEESNNKGSADCRLKKKNKVQQCLVELQSSKWFAPMRTLNHLIIPIPTPSSYLGPSV